MSITLAGYRVTESSTWIQYNKQDPGNLFVSDAQKIHIAIQNDSDILNKVLPLVCAILAKPPYQVVSFKTVNPDLKNAKGTNVDGKELVIYMQTRDNNSQESKPNFWITLLLEIENTLEKNGIPRHERGASGDLLVTGSKGYTYYRNSSNVGGQYVSTDILKKSGFTRSESCNISSDNFAEHFILPNNQKESGIKQQSSQIERTWLTPDNYIELETKKDAILQTLKTQLQKNINILKLFIGSEGNEYCGDATTRELVNKLFGTRLQSEKKRIYFSENSSIDFVMPFQNELEKATVQLAKLCHVLETNNLSINYKALGTILPALYFQFFIPMYKNQPSQKLNEKDSEAFINSIVRCALRSHQKIAIDYPTPQYIHDLTESEVTSLFSCINQPEKQNQITPIDPKVPKPLHDLQPLITILPPPTPHLMPDSAKTQEDRLPLKPNANETNTTEKLREIVHQLIENITQGINRNTKVEKHPKIEMLSGIENELKKRIDEILSDNMQNEFIQRIMTACEKKRNPIHFWATPHSVNEFKKLLDDKGINYPDKSSAPNKNL